MLSYLLLPNNNTYSFTGGLKHSEKYDQLQHLIIFSRPEDTPCYTLSDVNLAFSTCKRFLNKIKPNKIINSNKKNLNFQIDIANVQLKGLFAFKCGIKETLFLTDKFHGLKTSNKLELTNYLRSNTLANILTTNVNYEKRLDHHIIKSVYIFINILSRYFIPFY